MFVVKARFDFGCVAGVVEFQEAVQDSLADHGADGVPGALAGVVEAMVQARVQQIGPTVGADHRLVDRAVDVTYSAMSASAHFGSCTRLYVAVRPACLASIRSRRNVSRRSPYSRISAVTSGSGSVSNTSEGA